MKYFTNLFVFLVWYLEKISDINATSITQKEQIQKLRLFHTWRSDPIEPAKVMIALKRNILFLTDKNAYIIHSENTAQILKIEGINMNDPTSIIDAPDGAFDVPSVTVTSKDKISQLDVSDPLRPRLGSVLASGTTYAAHVWINKNEFLTVRYDEITHFENKNEVEAKEWNSKAVTYGQFQEMVLFQYAPKSFAIVYSRSDVQIIIMWAQDAEGKPGDWRNGQHVRKSYIRCDSYFLTTADVNNDGKTDLLVSTELEKEIDGKRKRHVEVRAFEIPEEFKDSDKYKEHVLISSVIFTPSFSACIKHLKAFTPFTSYKGKPWILVSHSACGGASYLQPESEEVGNWNYKMIQFHLNGGAVHGIEVADLNQDVYTELLILADSLYEYSFSNVTITEIDPPSASSSIFYLDSTVLMFIWLFL